MMQDTASSFNLLKAIRVSMRESRRDLTTGSMNRAIFALAVPMALEMVLGGVFSVVNIFWVARLGADSVTAVGITETIATLAHTLGLGLGLSTTAMIARRIGEKDSAGASRAAAQAVLLSLVVSVVLGIPLAIQAPALLRAMGATAEVVTAGASYARVILGTCGLILMISVNNAILRSSGSAPLAMRVLWVTNIVNLVLDPCLIFGWGYFPRMGVAGAAVATCASRTLGLVYQHWKLKRGTHGVRLAWPDLRPKATLLRRLIRVALPGVLQFAVVQTSWIALVRIIGLFGSEAIAGYTIAYRVLLFFLLPAWGLSGAAAVLVGQSLGARLPDRAQSAVWRTALFNTMFLGTVGLFFAVFAPSVVRVFTADPEVGRIGAQCLWLLSFGNVLNACGMVFQQAFNGAGDTVTPTVINAVGFYIVGVPLAYALATQTELGLQGVFVAVLLVQLGTAVVSVGIFRQFRWKHQRI